MSEWTEFIDNTEIKMDKVKPDRGVFYGSKVNSDQKRSRDNIWVHLSQSRLSILPFFQSWWNLHQLVKQYIVKLCFLIFNFSWIKKNLLTLYMFIHWSRWYCLLYSSKKCMERAQEVLQNDTLGCYLVH